MVCIVHTNNSKDGSPSASKHFHFLFLVLSVYPTAFTLFIHDFLTGAISDLSFTVGSLTYVSILPHLSILPSTNKCYYSAFLSFLKHFLFVLISGFIFFKNAGPHNIIMLMQSIKHPNYTFQVFTGFPWKAVFSMSKFFHIHVQGWECEITVITSLMVEVRSIELLQHLLTHCLWTLVV